MKLERVPVKLTQPLFAFPAREDEAMAQIESMALQL
jgi:hypothetical protein